MAPDVKDYIDSRDAAAEARAAAASLENKTRLEAFEKWAAASLEELRRTSRALERRMDNIEQAMIAMKKTVILTGITATLSTVFGVGAFNAALLSNMQASYESGRNVTVAQMAVQQQIRTTEALLRQAQATLDTTTRMSQELEARIKALPQPPAAARQPEKRP